MEPEWSKDQPRQVPELMWGARIITSIALGIAYGAAFQNVGGGLVMGLGVGIMSRRSVLPVVGFLFTAGLFWVALSS